MWRRAKWYLLQLGVRPVPGKARTWTSFPVMRSLMNFGLPWAVPSRVTPWGTIVTEYRPKVLCLQGIRQALGVATGVFMETCLSHIYGALGIVGWLWMLSCGGRDAFFNSERPRIRARSSSYSFFCMYISLSLDISSTRYTSSTKQLAWFLFKCFS